ncbi:MAG TPA: DUF2125 domain-containing protein [Rhizomicrobium sp.]|jgi:hypothetical protein|nr:DUF2125 domain-containing protein [Rhizomicrobium sp.]
MRYSSRFFLYVPLLFLLMLAVAAMLRWQAVAAGLERRLLRVNGHEIAPGVALRFGSEKVSGFPFNVDALLAGVTVETGSAHRPIVWHTEQFAIHELTFGRAQQIYEAAGRQSVSWTDADGAVHRFVFVPGSLRASAIESGGRLVRFDLDINGIGSPDLSGARAQLHFRKAPDRDAIDVVLSADDLHLAPALQAGFGAAIKHLTVEGSLAPAAPFASLFSGAAEWQGALEKWRLDRGVFRIATFDVTWGRLSAEGNGRFMLDERHRPLGRLDLRVEGNLPADAGAEAPLAHALLELTKTPARDARLAPGFSIDIAAGKAGVRRASSQQSAIPAGSLAPIY